MQTSSSDVADPSSDQSSRNRKRAGGIPDAIILRPAVRTLLLAHDTSLTPFEDSSRMSTDARSVRQFAETLETACSTCGHRARAAPCAESLSSARRTRSRSRMPKKLAVRERKTPDSSGTGNHTASQLCPQPRGATLSFPSTSRPESVDIKAEGRLQAAGKAQEVLVELRNGLCTPSRNDVRT